IRMRKPRIQVGSKKDRVVKVRAKSVQEKELVVKIGAENSDRLDFALGGLLDKACDEALGVVELVLVIGNLILARKDARQGLLRRGAAAAFARPIFFGF